MSTHFYKWSLRAICLYQGMLICCLCTYTRARRVFPVSPMENSLHSGGYNIYDILRITWHIGVHCKRTAVEVKASSLRKVITGTASMVIKFGNWMVFLNLELHNNPLKFLGCHVLEIKRTFSNIPLFVWSSLRTVFSWFMTLKTGLYDCFFHALWLKVVLNDRVPWLCIFHCL